MLIEVFYIAGCPNHSPTVHRVKAVLKELQLAGEVVERLVNDAESATALRFLGSPTIHISGVDVEPSARTSNQFGLMCRTYVRGAAREGIPSTELIRQSLLEAINKPASEIARMLTRTTA